MTLATKVAVGAGASGLVLGVWADWLFRGQPLGINVLLWTVAFVVALALLLRLAEAPLHQGRRWMLAPLLVFSAAFLWHAAPVLTAANMLALAGAATLGALRRTEQRAERAAVADYVAGFLAAGCAAAAGAIHLLHADVEWNEVGRAIRTERMGSVARGIGLGIPLIVLFGSLFMAADAVFRSLVTAAVPPFEHPLAHLLIIVGVAWVTAGLLRDLLAAREEHRLVSPLALAARRPRFLLGPTEVGIVMGALNALFLAFVLVQFRYLFGGADLVEARAHLTYAQYARHGFFELLAVSVLVLVVLLAVDVLVRRNGGARLLTLLSAGLVALVFVVMFSALQRMRLYEQAYGLTELRVYAVGVILWLGAVFLWYSATVLRGRRSSFAVGAVIAGFAATAALNVVNPDALIARTNLDRSRVDVAYLGRLSDDAVPALLDELPTLPPDKQSALALELLRRDRQEVDWRSFNFSRARAAALLEQHHDELVQLARGAR
jgi:uncharacterized protein DUF4153